MLTPLRQDLQLYPGAPDIHGWPTWVIEDPAAHRFFSIDYPTFELLSRWHLGDADDVLADLKEDTLLELDANDIEATERFISENELVVSRGAGIGAKFETRLRERNRAVWRQLLQRYLFFRVPLIRPDRWLDLIAPYCAIFYTRRYWAGMSALLCLSLYLVIQDWSRFTATFTSLGSAGDWLVFFLIIAVSKIAHELGHAVSAKRFGCRVPTMGVAFLVLWPVLYTDTNDAWKLRSRRERLTIAGSGILVELNIAILALALWSFLPDGSVRAGVFFLAAVTWLVTLAINLNPFVRFDGYFLLSDALKIPNLHEKSFELGRWWIRRRVLGLPVDVPRDYPNEWITFLVLFAFFTWLYRFLLFLGIALVIYVFFFKALGIALMVIELVTFIGIPVMKELNFWWQNRMQIRRDLYTLGFIALLASLLLYLCLPLPHRVSVPAVSYYEEFQSLYSTQPARVSAVNVSKGEWVTAGDALIEFEAPDLVHQLQQLTIEANILAWQLERQTTSARLLQQGTVLVRRLESTESRIISLTRDLERLKVVAPFDGLVTEMNPAIREGVWVGGDELLLSLSNPNSLVVDGYVDEDQVAAIDTTRGATFYANDLTQAALRCRSARLEQFALAVLDRKIHASAYGGSVLVDTGPDGRLVPSRGIYRVVVSDCENPGRPIKELRGDTVFSGQYRSLIMTFARRVMAVLNRELSF